MSDIAAMTDTRIAFVRSKPFDPLPPPVVTSGPFGWMRENLFSSARNILLTLFCAALIVWSIPPLIDFLFLDAVWDGASRADCIVSAQRPEVGACWAFVIERFGFFTYGFYPVEYRWRVDVFFVLLAFGIAWITWLDAPRRELGMIYFFVIVPPLSYFLLYGFPLFMSRSLLWLGGASVEPLVATLERLLPRVATAQWGGIMVTIVVAWVGIVVSLPLGVLLALGRRSHLPVVRTFCVAFIEFVRGVPLITMLFMVSVMLPLFVPEHFTPDKLLRALIGVALFASAYMAEVVRAGLQAIPKGQYEAAEAVGLTYWQGMRLVVLPQALKITIPNIVNTYIGLFKDTTLVFIVGIFDFLKTVEAARGDVNWAAPNTSVSGYAFAAMFYFVFCYAMSRYARYVERRLAAGSRR